MSILKAYIFFDIFDKFPQNDFVLIGGESGVLHIAIIEWKLSCIDQI